MNIFSNRRLPKTWLLYLLGFVVLAVFFNYFAGFDIYVSSLFYNTEQAKWLGNSSFLISIRELVYFMMAATPIFALIMLIMPIFIASPNNKTDELWRIDQKIWSAIIWIYLIGPGLIVNLILKENWGRARPFNIEAFGGKLEFSLPFILSDQCTSNCSFTSGEGAGATAMFIACIMIALAWQNKIFLRVIMPFIGILSITAIALRVGMGRHFLSDTFTSILITCFITSIVFWFFGLEWKSLSVLGKGQIRSPEREKNIIRHWFKK